MEWKVYILKCCDWSFYTWITTDLKRRVEEHNFSEKWAKYTKTRRPVELIYYEEYENRSESSSREYEIKRLPRSKKEVLIKNFEKSIDI